MAARSSACLLALVLFTCGALASIEREPVKVDRNNAGPKYDIDELERTRVLTENNNHNHNHNQDSNQVVSGPRLIQAPDSNERDDSSHQDTPVISIRRIFLVPVSRPGDEDGDRQTDPLRAMFDMPPPRSMFSPFSTRHLFGADEASRPRQDESQERPVMSGPPSVGQPEDGERPQRPMAAMFDPVEMLMEAMRQALNPANMMLPPPPPTPQTPDTADLNKEASSAAGPNSNKPQTGLEKPKSFNSTKEDIVEIDGKKYLRKTVVNHHVGDGIMFMTRRLIFSPLNETETTDTTSTTTEAPVNKDSTSTIMTSEPPTEQPSRVEKVDDEQPSSTAASGPIATEQPKPPLEPSSSTTAATEKEETTAKSPEERLVEAGRILEKMVESTSTSTTEKPSA